MRTISSEKYALLVDDVVTSNIEWAIIRIVNEVNINCGLKMPPGEVAKEFWLDSMATVRNQVIELLELNGLDVRPNDEEW